MCWINLILRIIVAVHSVTSSSTLRFVFITTRGGDHELCTYIGGPNITHTNVNEMDSRLTSGGKDAAFELGQEISKKYKNCLGISSWNNQNYWSFGGTAKRHQEEALLIGTGLENNAHLISHNWTEAELKGAKFPKIEYYYRFFYPSECPEFFKELSSSELIKEFKELLEKYGQSIQELKKNYDEVNITILYQVWISYETIQRMISQGQQPKWWTEEIENGLRSFSEEYLYKSLTHTKKLRRLAGGSILSDVLNDMDKIMSGKGQPLSSGKSKIKISIFTTSQTVVGAQLAAFAPTDTIIGDQLIVPRIFYPETGAAHIIELHKMKNGDWKVKMIYKNGKNNGNSYQDMIIPGCDKMCPYEKFRRKLRKFRLSEDQQEKECKSKKSKHNTI